MSPQNARPKLPHADAPALAPVQASPVRERKGAKISLAGALPPARIPPEALASPRRFGAVGIALITSLALHAVAVAIHFSPFDFSRLVDKEPPLELTDIGYYQGGNPAGSPALGGVTGWIAGPDGYLIRKQLQLAF